MRLAAVTGLVIALLFIAYGVWLVVTPDYDGGRRPVGGLVLGLAVPLFLGSIWALSRKRRDSPL